MRSILQHALLGLMVTVAACGGGDGGGTTPTPTAASISITSSARSDAAILTMADSRLGQFFESSANHDYLKLPSIVKAGPGDWRAVSLPLSFEAVSTMRRELIRSAVLSYQPQRPADPPLPALAWVGKGIVYDTGGLSMKGKTDMPGMKSDMGGSAAVLAAFSAAVQRGYGGALHALLCLAENSVGPSAIRPDDILTLYSGKTVEIINTDAEGRLVLADVLAYGKELKPDLMLDNATLTGACVVALGPTVSGFYANKDELAERMKKAVKDAGEAMWHMPLVEELREAPTPAELWRFTPHRRQCSPCHR